MKPCFRDPLKRKASKEKQSLLTAFFESLVQQGLIEEGWNRDSVVDAFLRGSGDGCHGYCNDPKVSDRPLDMEMIICGLREWD